MKTASRNIILLLPVGNINSSTQAHLGVPGGEAAFFFFLTKMLTVSKIKCDSYKELSTIWDADRQTD